MGPVIILPRLGLLYTPVINAHTHGMLIWGRGREGDMGGYGLAGDCIQRLEVSRANLEPMMVLDDAACGPVMGAIQCGAGVVCVLVFVVI